MLGCLFLGILQYRVSYDRDCKGSDLSKHKKIDPFALECNCVWNHFRYCCFSEHPSIHFLSPLTRHHAVLVWRRRYTLNKSAVFHTAITIINTWFRKSAGKHIPCCQWRPNSRLLLIYCITIQVQLKSERSNVAVCGIYQSCRMMSLTTPPLCFATK